MSYWAKTYGPGKAKAVAVDKNGDIIVAGEREEDAFVARLDGDGNVKWFKTYGGEYEDVFNDVKIAPNGDIVVAGYYGATDEYGSGANVWILRLDENGNVKWQKTYGGNVYDDASAVVLAPNGDIIVTGKTLSFGAGGTNIWVLRLDENGNVKWQKTYGGSNYDYAEAVAIAPNGNIIVAGWTLSFGAGDRDVWVLRLDENGNVKWQKTYGGSSTDVANAVALAPNGDIIIAGNTWSFGAGDADVWILRLDENGNVKWQKTYGGKNGDVANAVALADNGDIIVAGWTGSFGAGKDDAWVFRLDENGNVKWQKTYGGSDYDWANAVALANNSDIIIAGYYGATDWDGSGANVWILRPPPDGNLSGREFCSDSNAQVMDTNAEVHNTNCEVLSGVRKYQVEVGLIRMRKEWRTERVSLVVMDSKAVIKSLNVTPNIQYYLDPEPLMQNLQNSLSFSVPQLVEGVDSVLKLSVYNTFAKSLKLTLDLSGNEFFELEEEAFEFPELQKGQKITKTLTVTPKYAGKFDFKIKIKAVVNGIELEAEKVIPVEVGEKAVTPPVQSHTPPVQTYTPAQFTPSPTTPKTLPPELVELYTDVEFIGKGGFARVFKAKRKRDGKVVAIKIPISLDSATGKSFLREIENWTKLKHPNIVRVYDYNILPVPFFEMEYCEDSLENLLRRSGHLPPMEAAGIIFDIAEGLKYAHSLRIIHRDLKPSNILLKQGIPKISDWGLSKVLKESRSTTFVSFTPYYAAPEQISKSKFGSTDERTDIWQLGVIFYQLVTGKLPFEGEDFVEVSSSIVYETPERPSEINPDAEPLDDIIMRCLAKRKEERYESTAELQGELALLLGMEYRRNLKKSAGAGDLSRSAYYAGELLLVNLKVGDLTGAYKYAGDLAHYARGNVVEEIIALKEQIRLRLEEGLDIPPELMEKAEIIVHKVKLGWRDV